MAMTRITVRLADDIVDWARAQAASKSMPLSRFLGEFVTKRMEEWLRREDAARRGLAEFPAGPGGPGRST
jgi:predicted transcriptional regulator